MSQYYDMLPPITGSFYISLPVNFHSSTFLCRVTKTFLTSLSSSYNYLHPSTTPCPLITLVNIFSSAHSGLYFPITIPIYLFFSWSYWFSVFFLFRNRRSEDRLTAWLTALSRCGAVTVEEHFSHDSPSHSALIVSES